MLPTTLIFPRSVTVKYPPFSLTVRRIPSADFFAFKLRRFFPFMPRPIEQDDEPPLEVETVPDAAEDDATAVLVAAEVISDTSKPKPPPRKRPSKKKPQTPSSDNVYELIQPQRVEAALDARATLEETVQSLPVTLPGPVTETQVRSFGRLCIKGSNDEFNSTSALYPVGFSCDRFDFSPVHGRIIKLRCSILSGRSVKKSQRKGGFPVSDIPDGPIFRIVWGQGVDDEEDCDYPFNPANSAPPIVATGFSQTDSAIEEVMTTTPAHILPEVGMKVKVRFEKNQFFGGVITSVGELPAPGAKTKRKRKQVDVTIQYDDGSTESFLFPDPDLSLELPGQSQYSINCSSNL
jgi:F/Y-rich N-terminus